MPEDNVTILIMLKIGPYEKSAVRMPLPKSKTSIPPPQQAKMVRNAGIIPKKPTELLSILHAFWVLKRNTARQLLIPTSPEITAVEARASIVIENIVCLSR